MKPVDPHMSAQDFFESKNPVKELLKIALELFDAKQTGILYGTDETKQRFLPTRYWDRGIMDAFDGKGLRGLVLKLFGRQIVTYRKLSPVQFYKRDLSGQRTDNDGIIAHVLRNSADFYKKGIRVILCPDTRKYIQPGNETYSTLPYFVYDGHQIVQPIDLIRADTRIMKEFASENSIYIYLPDYGILVINTARIDLMEQAGLKFVREEELRTRMDVLIKLVEESSLAYLGKASGKKRAHLIWQKEGRLQETSHQLMEHEKQYRELYENAPIAYLSLNPDGRIVHCNQKAAGLFGCRKQTLLGRKTQDLFWKGSKENVLQVGGLAAMAGKRSDKDSQWRIMDAASLWVDISVDAIKDSKGDVVEFRVMLVDISTRKEMEKQLLASQKMEAMGTLAGGIAHDFNNVLSPISGYTEMLLMDNDETQTVRPYLETILESVAQAKELLNQILIFSLQKKQELQVLNVSQTIQEALILVRSFLPATIRTIIEIEESCGNILADPIQIHQVVIHLVTNAYHAMESYSGTLRVSLQTSAGSDMGSGDLLMAKSRHVCLTVEDTGVGIDPAIVDKIFDPYFSTQKDGKRTGVGLSVVQGIVESCNGHIRVESRQNHGTRFDLYFPVYTDDPSTIGESANHSQIQKGTERILLMDSHKAEAISNMRMLEGLGYKVTCFTTAPNAVQVFKNNADLFDLVFADPSDSVLSAIKFVEDIKTAAADVPIVIYTDYARALRIQLKEDFPVAAILKKPLESKYLSFILRQVLTSDSMFKSGKGSHQQAG